MANSSGPSSKDGKGKRSARPAEADAGVEPLVGAAFRVSPGPVHLADHSTEFGPIGPRSKSEAVEALAAFGEPLQDLQSRLTAAASAGGRERVLLILQGMDTSGKDGVINHTIGLLSPLGLRLAAFKKPTAQELAHDFLWRIEKEVPGPGQIGVFNRSQYEDVLVVRVHDLVPSEVWAARYDAINAFEQAMTDDGVTVVKCFLHISADAQADRLTARLEDPAKLWKYNPGDVDERAHWEAYQQAYAAALERCSTEAAPWYVIPSDHKWYRNWAIGALLTEVLRDLDPQYPPPSFDVEAEKARLNGLLHP